MPSVEDVFSQRLGNTRTYEFAPASAQLALGDDELYIEASADATKRLKLDVSALTTATTRTLTVRDVSGMLPVYQFATVITPISLIGDTSEQAVFGTANDALTVVADTTYFFDALYHLTTGTTTHTTSTVFTLTTASLTSIKYVSVATSSAANTLATPQVRTVAVATASPVTATSTAADTIIVLRGIMRVNAGGTVTPKIAFSADPVGGTHTVNVDSYFKLWAAGSKTVLAAGAWA